MGGYLWSFDELDALKRVWPLFISQKISQDELINVLSHRTFAAISKQAGVLGMPKNRTGDVNTEALNELLKRYKL